MDGHNSNSVFFIEAPDPYTRLGAMALVDIETFPDEADIEIAHYVECAEKLTADNAVHLILGPEKNLIGYVIANGLTNEPKHIASICDNFEYIEGCFIGHRNKISGREPSSNDGGMALAHFRRIGCALELFVQSEDHRNHFMAAKLEWDLLPALTRKQAKIYFDANDQPTALVTWAFFSDEVLQKVIDEDYDFEGDEWNSGTNVFVHDWISPYGNIREIMFDMANNVFPDNVVIGLRRNPEDETIRHVGRWTGVNLRRKIRSERFDRETSV
jgi:cytolysin-activating lysine-acyltransferase